MKVFCWQWLLLVCLCGNSISVHAQLILPKEQANEDLACLQTALEHVHPRLYKYTSKTTLDSLFNEVQSNIQRELSGLDLLSQISIINAQVNCGHLYTIPQGELREEVQNKMVMPFYVKVLANKLFLYRDCSESGKSRNGSEILTINGKSSTEILQTMRQGIATDGYIITRQDRLIERYFFNTFHGFDLYYHLHVDRSSMFDIELRKSTSQEIQSVEFHGISINERRKRLQSIYGIDEEAWFKNPSPQFVIAEDQSYATLALNRSFHNEEIDPDFSLFLQNIFHQLAMQSIPNLIVDLRNNEGGSEQQQMELISYLAEQPFKLYQNIFLSKLDYRPLTKVIIERDSVDLVFNNDDNYMRKFSNDLWINNYEYSPSLREQSPQPNRYQGNLFVLINGLTFSSAADLAGAIKKTTNAVFIGEESGGTFEGPTGGASIVIQLPNSQIMVRISPNIHISSQYEQHPFGRGIIPNHPVQYSIEDILNGVDLEMKKAIELIHNE